MEPVVDVYYFGTKEERRTFVTKAVKEGRELFALGKVSEANAQNGKRFRAVFFKPEEKEHTTLKVECSWCGISLGEKDGQGVEGTTSGICPECENIEYLLFARRIVKEKKVSWEQAKKIAFAGREKKA